MSIITGGLNIGALAHVKMEVKGKNGMVKGIFIPFDVNNLAVTEKGGVFLNLVAFEMKEKKDYGTHIVKQSFSKEVRAQMGEETLKEKPILGNLNVDNTPSEKNNDVGEGKVYKEQDDLPF